MTLIRIIDTETAGFDSAVDHLVEIASIDMEAEKPHVQFNALQTFVKPPIPIPPTASAVHHIIDADVALAPDAATARAMFDGADIYCAHNNRFDMKFIDFGKPWIDTYRSALRAWPDAPGHSNQVLRYWLSLSVPRDVGPAHRAMADVEVTAKILAALLRSHPLETLLEWSSKPAILPIVRFGKHHGSRWEDVDTGYLDWILSKGDEFDEDVRATARHHRELRSGGAR